MMITHHGDIVSFRSNNKHGHANRLCTTMQITVAMNFRRKRRARGRREAVRGDNDNDNDTLREVPHQTNEGLALQARVSGPWPHKKESVLLVELARWQGVQVLNQASGSYALDRFRTKTTCV